jgi:hypothetical protein
MLLKAKIQLLVSLMNLDYVTSYREVEYYALHQKEG